MPALATRPVNNAAIRQINSLGGPQLPTGVSTGALKIILENMSAAQTAPANDHIADALLSRVLPFISA